MKMFEFLIFHRQTSCILPVFSRKMEKENTNARSFWSQRPLKNGQCKLATYGYTNADAIWEPTIILERLARTRLMRNIQAPRRFKDIYQKSRFFHRNLRRWEMGNTPKLIFDCMRFTHNQNFEDVPPFISRGHISNPVNFPWICNICNL